MAAELNELTDTYHLFSCHYSTCSSRIIVAAYLKSIPLTYTYIDLASSTQTTPLYLAQNPNATVPTLIITHPSGAKTTITQSLSILEYWEDKFPDRGRLLPRDPEGRAKVRDVVNSLASDVQPLTNKRVVERVGTIGGEEGKREWVEKVVRDGFGAVEKLLEQNGNGNGGRFSYGEEITLADVFLWTAVDSAMRWKLDLGDFPNVRSVFERLNGLKAFRAGHWSRQGDTPERFRKAIDED